MSTGFQNTEHGVELKETPDAPATLQEALEQTAALVSAMPPIEGGRGPSQMDYVPVSSGGSTPPYAGETIVRDAPGLGPVTRQRVGWCGGCCQPLFAVWAKGRRPSPGCSTCRELEVIASILASAHNYATVREEADLLAEDLNRLAAHSPLLAGVISRSLREGIPGPAETAPIALGVRRVHRYFWVEGGHSNWLRADIQAVFAKHASGDFGLFGNLAEVTLSEDHRFAAELFPVAVRNALALESGHGAIRGRHRLSQDAEWALARVRPSLNPIVDIVTILGREPATFVTVVDAAGTCFGAI